jgi:thymidylate synthase ThyX
VAYEDAKHRPHAMHTGEEPKNEIDIGPSALKVTLDTWGPKKNLFSTIYDALQSNWGEAPERSGDQDCSYMKGSNWTVEGNRPHLDSWEHQTDWCVLNAGQQAYVESCFAGKTLQQILEMITFTFTVDGVTRAFTHEFVRARIGSGFMQHGGRDNDWRHRRWTLPETIRRASAAMKTLATDWADGGQRHCITNWDPILEYLGRREKHSLTQAISDHLTETKALYAALVDAGIPWQDARRVLPIGSQTYIHGTFNYVALAGVLRHRLEHIMDWEINCVAQLMVREIRMKCPPLLSKYLGSHSDLAKRAMFDGLESWPPDGKWPSNKVRCAFCRHAEGNHRRRKTFEGHQFILPDEMECEVCMREGDHPPLHRFVPEDSVPRQHRREQMPFFVLHPDSMAGGDVRWLWTNGRYSDIQTQLKEENSGQEKV